ncbi:MAG TPA: hypothetical protein DCX45_03445 [Acinetobacter junii]|nr:hypothetical protein [Acinetobacter junii]
MSEIYKNRYVSTSFWTDTYILEKLDPIERLLYLYLITNDRSNIAGVYELSVKKMANETGIEKDNCVRILKRFVDDNKIALPEGWIIIYNVFKHQTYNPSMIKGVIKIINELPLSITGLQVFKDIYLPIYFKYCHEPDMSGRPIDRLGTGSTIININRNINSISEEGKDNVNNYVDNPAVTNVDKLFNIWNRKPFEHEVDECNSMISLFGYKIVKKGFDAAKNYKVLNLNYVMGVCRHAKPEITKAINEFSFLTKVNDAIKQQQH